MKALEYKLKIPKRTLLRLLILVALLGGTFLLDHYFENHPLEMEAIDGDASQQDAGELRIVCFLNPGNAFTVKGAVQKIFSRRFSDPLHDKRLRKYHQTLNYQLYRIKTAIASGPPVISYLYLQLRSVYFPDPDDDPMNS